METTNYQDIRVSKHHNTTATNCAHIYHRGSATVDLYATNIGSKCYGNTHSALMKRLDQAQSGILRLKRQHDEVTKQCIQLKIERTNAMQAMLDAVAKNDSLKSQLNKYMQQDNRESRLQCERDAAIHEYNLVMQERDSVHKDIDRLQDELHATQRKCSILESETRISASEIENLKGKLGQIRQERDKALIDCQELRNRLNRVMSETAAALASTSPLYGSTSTTAERHTHIYKQQHTPDSMSMTSRDTSSRQSMLDSASSNQNLVFTDVLSRKSNSTHTSIDGGTASVHPRRVAEQLWNKQQQLQHRDCAKKHVQTSSAVLRPPLSQSSQLGDTSYHQLPLPEIYDRQHTSAARLSLTSGSAALQHYDYCVNNHYVPKQEMHQLHLQKKDQRLMNLQKQDLQKLQLQKQEADFLSRRIMHQHQQLYHDNKDYKNNNNRLNLGHQSPSPRASENPLAHYGFEISDTNSTGTKGIFVTAINEGSILEKVDIKVGDQLLEVNGVNLRGVSRAAACRVLSYQTEETIKIAYKRNSGPQCQPAVNKTII